MTRHALQSLFDAADDFVDAEYAKGTKRWLPALRDSTALEVAYAYGLRRRELTRLRIGGQRVNMEPYAAIRPQIASH